MGEGGKGFEVVSDEDGDGLGFGLSVVVVVGVEVDVRVGVDGDGDVGGCVGREEGSLVVLVLVLLSPRRWPAAIRVLSPACRFVSTWWRKRIKGLSWLWSWLLLAWLLLV